MVPNRSFGTEMAALCSVMLWLIRVSAYEQPCASEEMEDQYHLVHAQDQPHAATLAREWLKQRSHLSYHHFTACPEGFIIGDISVLGRQTRETEV